MTVTITRLSPPSWVEERLRSCPRVGQGVKTWLFSTARALAPYISKAELVELSRRYSAGCGRVVGRGEILRQVQQGIRAKACGQAPGWVPTQHSKYTDRGVPPVPISKIHFESEILSSLVAPADPAMGIHVWINDAVHLLRGHDPKAVAAAIRHLLELHGWEIPADVVDAAVHDMHWRNCT